MFSICSSSHSIPLEPWKRWSLSSVLRPNRRIRVVPWAIPSSVNGDSVPLNYDHSGEILRLDGDQQSRIIVPGAVKLRSWIGPNGQYIKELPCPSCRSRGYTPCTECGIERSRSNCPQCNGKGLRTCCQCMGDCVIWEESIDERPWEKARSSSPLKVKEDDEVDNLEIKVNVMRKSKRVYQPSSPEVSSKISRSLRSLNAKTGMLSKRMKILHQDPILHAQRVAAIKKTKGTATARMQASERMTAFFRDPENRFKRSIAMTGVKFYCSHCKGEGHRRHYCPTQRKASGKVRFKCGLCGKRGHNRRTCPDSRKDSSEKEQGSSRCCGACGQRGHDRRTCPQLAEAELGILTLEKLANSGSRTYTCSVCFEKGHDIRRCPKTKAV